jgi:hypothetical protein
VSLADGVGHHAVNAYGGEQDRDARENAEQLHEKARVSEGLVQHALHGGDVSHRLIGIDFGDGVFHECREIGGGICSGDGSNDQRFVQVGACCAAGEGGGLFWRKELFAIFAVPPGRIGDRMMQG